MLHSLKIFLNLMLRNGLGKSTDLRRKLKWTIPNDNMGSGGKWRKMKSTYNSLHITGKIDEQRWQVLTGPRAAGGSSALVSWGPGPEAPSLAWHSLEAPALQPWSEAPAWVLLTVTQSTTLITLVSPSQPTGSKPTSGQGGTGDHREKALEAQWGRKPANNEAGACAGGGVKKRIQTTFSENNSIKNQREFLCILHL